MTMKQVLVVCPNPSIDIFAWIDSFQYGVPNRVSKELRYPGGKGLHVAMALAELGIPVTVAGFWGGEAGNWIRKACNEYYPSIKFTGPTLNEWSRSCYTFKAQDDFDDTEILGPGPSISKENFDELTGSIARELPGTGIMALCGSWPKGSPDTGYKSIIALGKTHQVPSFLDCTGVQLKNGLSARPFGVHLNRKEITDFYGLDFDQAKEKLLSECEVAAVTDGSKGLYLMNQTTGVHALTKVQKVISTIGSGDCLLAGIVAGYTQDLPFAEIARLGATCGAANCLRPDLGMLHRSDVDTLLPESLITSL